MAREGDLVRAVTVTLLLVLNLAGAARAEWMTERLLDEMTDGETVRHYVAALDGEACSRGLRPVLWVACQQGVRMAGVQHGCFAPPDGRVGSATGHVLQQRRYRTQLLVTFRGGTDEADELPAIVAGGMDGFFWRSSPDVAHVLREHLLPNDRFAVRFRAGGGSRVTTVFETTGLREILMQDGSACDWPAYLNR